MRKYPILRNNKPMKAMKKERKKRSFVAILR